MFAGNILLFQKQLSFRQDAETHKADFSKREEPLPKRGDDAFLRARLFCSLQSSLSTHPPNTLYLFYGFRSNRIRFIEPKRSHSKIVADSKSVRITFATQGIRFAPIERFSHFLKELREAPIGYRNTFLCRAATNCLNKECVSCPRYSCRNKIWRTIAFPS